MTAPGGLGPLDGVRVVDFSRVLAGPLCTMLLGDLGADVVKVERPGAGDDTRGWGPPFVGEDAAYFLSLNRNKRSMVLDLDDPEDLGTAHALIRQSDVLVENFRTGLMDRFGLDPDSTRRTNPGLIYASISSFSGTDHALQPGYDIIVQALSGLMSITGPRDGEPVKVGVALLDVITGLYACVGILAALHARRSTGAGQVVSVSLFDASIAALVNQAANVLLGGVLPERMGTEHPNIVPYQVFSGRDRPFVVAAGNDRFFERLCDAIGRKNLADERHFATNAARVRNREALIPLLSGVFAAGSAEHWLEVLAAVGVPCAPVLTLEEVFESPDGAAMIEEVPDPHRGPLRLVRNPLTFSLTPTTTRVAPPRLGEHTADIRTELDRPEPPEPPSSSDDQ